MAKYIIEEKITEISFVGNVGGLLGLLMGFSFMSIIEMVYLCCLERGKPEGNKIEEQKETLSEIATA